MRTELSEIQLKIEEELEKRREKNLARVGMSELECKPLLLLLYFLKQFV
jgi:hypothetical protein